MDGGRSDRVSRVLTWALGLVLLASFLAVPGAGPAEGHSRGPHLVAAATGGHVVAAHRDHPDVAAVGGPGLPGAEIGSSPTVPGAGPAVPMLAQRGGPTDRGPPLT